MTRVPSVWAEGRAVRIGLIAASAAGQALAAGTAAVAMRQIFHGLHHEATEAPLLDLAVLLIAGLTIVGLRVYARAVGERLGQDFALSLRHALFTHLTRMPASAVAKRRQGALALRFVGDLAAARNWVGRGIPRILAALVVLPGAAVMLWVLNPDLCLVAITPLAVALVAMAVAAPLIPSLHEDLRSRRANLAIHMMERVSVAPELLLMGRRHAEFKKLSRRGEELRAAAVRWAEGVAALRALPEAGGVAAAVASLWLAFRGDMTPAEVAAALAVLAILAQPMRDLARVWDMRCGWRIARGKCEVLFSQPILEQIGQRPVPKSKSPAQLTFDRVTKGVLRDMSVTAVPGSKVAVIGPNGAGKSSCLALAAGIEQPEHGHVELDGIDIATLRESDKARTVFYIGPTPPILRGSLRSALTLGIQPRPEDTVIEAAARTYGLAAVLERLGGLGGRVTEGGRDLSSGEARRIHLVRAALAQPRLLLMDEPEAGLDDDGKVALRNLLEDTAATTLIVTKDPDLAACADTIWTLNGGTLTTTVLAEGSRGEGAPSWTSPRVGPSGETRAGLA